MTGSGPQHWDNLFLTTDPEQVSWYQGTPATSLRLIADAPGSVIDVGGGTATLVDELLVAGRGDVTVLDISPSALDATRRRLASDARQVHFTVADITAWSPARRFDVWHDRAVFHFLTDDAQRLRYVELVSASVTQNGVAILGTFAEDGPTHCSGLPVARYSADALAELFATGFVLEHAEREIHETPAGTAQAFTWVKLRKR
jgi:trans-aconitate methyltransferase